MPENGLQKKRKLRILFIIFSYSLGGGAESLLTTIVNNMDSGRYDISIIEIVGSDIKKEPVNSNIHVLPYMMKADDSNRKKKMYSFYHEWDKVIANYIPDDYDVYISFNQQRPVFLLPPNKNNISWIHSSMFQFAKDELKEERELQDRAFDKVKKIVAISDLTAESLEEVFPRHKDKIVKIYNGLDIDRVIRLSQEKTDIILEKPAILMSGRLEKRKAPDRLLRVFNEVVKAKENAHLYYMGYGPLEEELVESAKQMGLDSRVHFLGYQENPFPIVAQSDVVCLLSDCEGFPMSLLEAVALCKPFVATNIGGARELSDRGKCGSVTFSESEAAKEVIKWVDVSKEVIRNSSKSSVARFSLEKYIKQIEELIDEVSGI